MVVENFRAATLTLSSSSIFDCWCHGMSAASRNHIEGWLARALAIPSRDKNLSLSLRTLFKAQTRSCCLPRPDAQNWEAVLWKWGQKNSYYSDLFNLERSILSRYPRLWCPLEHSRWTSVRYVRGPLIQVLVFDSPDPVWSPTNLQAIYDRVGIYTALTR